MKESDLNVINIDLEEGNSNSFEDSRDGLFTQAYDKLPDISSRLRFCFYAVNVMEYKRDITEEEKRELSRIVEEFTQKYIENGSQEEREGVFRELGKMKAENNLHSFDEYQNQIKLLNAKDPLYKKKGKWLYEQTYAGLESGRLNNFIGRLKSMPGSIDLNELQVDAWMEDAKADYYEENKLSESKIKSLHQIEKLNNETYDYADIENWIEGEGDELSDRRLLYSKDQMGNQLREHYIENKPFVDPEQVRRISQKSDKIYHSLKTMEEKLDFLIEYGVMIASMDAKYVHEREIRNMADMREEFVNTYINGADPVTAKKVFEILAQKNADVSIPMAEYYTKYKEKYQNEGKAGIQKADMFARCSVPGAYASVIKGITGMCNNRFFMTTGTIETKDRFLREANIDLDKMTVEEYARMMGNSEENVKGLIEALGAKADDNIVEAQFNKAMREKANSDKLSEDAKAHIKKSKRSDLSDKLGMRVADTWVHDKMESRLKEMDYTKENREDLEHVMAMIQTVPNESEIRDWVATSQELANFKREQYSLAENDMLKKIDKTVGYDQYLRLHTGTDAIRLKGQAKADCLAKAMAAQVLKDSGNKFDLDAIHHCAIALERDPGFLKLASDPEKVNKALNDPALLQKTYQDMSQKSNAVKKGELKSYIQDMNKLLKTMMPSAGRSDEYKKFYRSVKNIAKMITNYEGIAPTDQKMNKADLKHAERKVAELNQIMLNAAEVYILGKEKVRTTDGGKERFNNTLDALALLGKYAPGAEESLKSVVDHINRKRDVKETSEKFVRLDNFGVKRATEAKAKRDAKNQKAADKPKEKPLLI